VLAVEKRALSRSPKAKMAIARSPTASTLPIAPSSCQDTRITVWSSSPAVPTFRLRGDDHGAAAQLQGRAQGRQPVRGRPARARNAFVHGGRRPHGVGGEGQVGRRSITCSVCRTASVAARPKRPHPDVRSTRRTGHRRQRLRCESDRPAPTSLRPAMLHVRSYFLIRPDDRFRAARLRSRQSPDAN
jgi:hypothetical protein